MTGAGGIERYRGIVDDYEGFAEACDRPLQRTARVNRVKSSYAEVTGALDDAGVRFEPVDWYDDGVRFLDDTKPGNTLAHYAGWIHVQEEVSMLPPLVADASEDDTVLDMCASPGSKTGMLAQDAGTVVANDVNIGRLSALRNNTDRLGLTNVAVTSYDGRNFPGEHTYDVVLVDAPCTAEGTVRKNPGAGDSDEAERSSVAGVQRGLLGRALELVSDDGRVVYSTCTFAPEENEAVLDSVVSGLDAEVVGTEVPLESSPGVTEWRGEGYDGSVARAHRVYPHQNDTGGFFVAALRG